MVQDFNRIARPNAESVAHVLARSLLADLKLARKDDSTAIV